MLPKQERLTKEDFNGARPKVFFRSSLFDAAILPGETKVSKFACVIAKKTQKRAVDRNLLKRRVMESIAKHALGSKHYIVIYPKKGLLETNYATLDDEIKKAFDTLH